MPPARVVFLAATLGGIVLTVRAVVIQPPPLGVALACVAAYAALVLGGVLDLRLRMFADAVVAGPPDAHGVVLTFDETLEAEQTPHLLDALDARGARAAFFVTGANADEHADLVREILRRGHTLGVRAWSDAPLFWLRSARGVERDLRRALRALEASTGARPTLFRPPGGHTNPTIARIAERLDLTIVGWSVRGRSRSLRDGAIVALTVEALPGVLDTLAERNVAVVDLAPWLPADDA
jgi:peptidoglycan/xylan/chitin deacetylase (PgdA/CDA1 family)